jgi:hypothetical protein
MASAAGGKNKAVPKETLEDKEREDAVPVLLVPEQPPIPVVVVDSNVSSYVDPAVAPAPPYVQPPIVPLNNESTYAVKGEKSTLSPTTTEAQDDTAEGQRKINLLWENTQSRIALMVVVAGVTINATIILMIIFLNKEVSVTQLALISISLQFINLTVGIVIGFYFSRTNHAATGGTGPKPAEPPYTGR